MQKDIVWNTLEHTHEEKSNDWFWALGIVSVSSAVAALLFGNVLFALLILIGAFTIGLLAKKDPATVEIALTPRGVLVGSDFYPYHLLVAFWIDEVEHAAPTLIIDAHRFLTPHIIVPLGDHDAEEVRMYLAQYLPEREIHEPVMQKALEFFGF